jgi:hypothetical protein
MRDRHVEFLHWRLLNHVAGTFKIKLPPAATLGWLSRQACVCLRRIYTLLGADRTMLPLLKLSWAMLLLIGALVASVLPVLTLKWLWWFLRRQCAQLVYRFLL